MGFGDRSCRGDRERSRDAEASHAKKRGGSEKEGERKSVGLGVSGRHKFTKCGVTASYVCIDMYRTGMSHTHAGRDLKIVGQ